MGSGIIVMIINLNMFNMRNSDNAPDAEILDKIELIVNKALGVIVAATFLSVILWAVFN